MHNWTMTCHFLIQAVTQLGCHPTDCEFSYQLSTLSIPYSRLSFLFRVMPALLPSRGTTQVSLCHNTPLRPKPPSVNCSFPSSKGGRRDENVGESANMPELNQVSFSQGCILALSLNFHDIGSGLLAIFLLRGCSSALTHFFVLDLILLQVNCCFPSSKGGRRDENVGESANMPELNQVSFSQGCILALSLNFHDIGSGLLAIFLLRGCSSALTHFFVLDLILLQVNCCFPSSKGDRRDENVGESANMPELNQVSFSQGCILALSLNFHDIGSGLLAIFLLRGCSSALTHFFVLDLILLQVNCCFPSSKGGRRDENVGESANMPELNQVSFSQGCILALSLNFHDIGSVVLISSNSVISLLPAIRLFLNSTILCVP
ncbi:hypothetical protein BLNAU_3875 [Blattamonas nauphoetae]|uniref:Uncharacterized protein n=1 Tax=Blattamonas nauphoetae TaxID=2049346 RepID=A0ABQ9YBG0_9EUKA|nr:hypothetical protein BLNAU_3875 [Blattamonas nauphoetae]